MCVLTVMAIGALRLDRLALEVTIENDKVTKQRLGLARQRMADLREQGIVSEAEFDEAHLLYQAVLKRLEHNRILLAETGQEFEPCRLATTW